MTTIIHEQRHIEQKAATAAMQVACLQVQLSDCLTLAKARRESAKAEIEQLAEYAEWDGQRAELEADTRERRQSISEARKLLDAAIDRSEYGRERAKERARIKELRARLDAATRENRQTLMPWAEG